MAVDNGMYWDRRDKAQAALKRATEIIDLEDGSSPLSEHEVRSARHARQLIAIAGVQAQLAIADAIERIADRFNFPIGIPSPPTDPAAMNRSYGKSPRH